jgi:DNA-binding NtrC family response regulator
MLAPLVAAADRRALGHEAFEALVEAEVARARFFGRKVSLLFLRPRRDEQAGPAPLGPDAVLQHLRAVDRVGRYGGSDLEVLFPEFGAEEAAAWARTLSAGGGRRLSWGVAEFPASAASSEELMQAARRALRDAEQRSGVSEARPPARSESRSAKGGPVFASAPMKAVFELAERLSRNLIPVLIHGETGTGKELIARTLHRSGPRKDKPLCSVNCGAIPAQLVESTLFGHEKGAFTGALKAQKGVFESAHGGTLFLDEIGELPLPVQAALLRVLESKTFCRVGSNAEVSVDVRLVAATHKDLEAMCSKGAFRQDLLFRLNAMTVDVPPLRDRPEDVIPLAEHFLAEANQANGTAVADFDPEALRALTGYAWPGNVRELRNVVERAVVIARETRVMIADLPERIQRTPEAPEEIVQTAPAEAAGADEDAAETELDRRDYKSKMQEAEARIILAALRDAGNNQTQAARLLGMPRRTLVEKIRLLGLRRAD